MKLRFLILISKFQPALQVPIVGFSKETPFLRENLVLLCPEVWRWKLLMYEFWHLISLTFSIGNCFCCVHCEVTLLFLRLRFEIYNYLLNSILWQIFREIMDKSKFHAIFEYEFRCGTNVSKTARKINSVFGEGSTSHSAVSFSFAKFCFGDFSLENEPRRLLYFV